MASKVKIKACNRAKWHKLSVKIMYDWSYGEKVLLTAWSPIVSNNQANNNIQVWYFTKILYILLCILVPSKSIWSLVTKENKRTLTKKHSSYLANYGCKGVKRRGLNESIIKWKFVTETFFSRWQCWIMF